MLKRLYGDTAGSSGARNSLLELTRLGSRRVYSSGGGRSPSPLPAR